MIPVELTINGKPVKKSVEPRLSLADFLRDHLRLTGTHTGCEHGVCGACTVEIDGQIARSCINLAVTCDGAQVRSIEGFDDDPLMEKLRQAFTAEHALQCGYCTPGMLIAARDLVRRKPGADVATVRHAMSGNLCRCTGYVGILRAIQRVIGEPLPIEAVPAPKAVVAVTQTTTALSPAALPASRAGWTTVEQTIDLPHPPEKVWALFQDLARVALCMPGAELVDYAGGDRAKGRVTAKFGPISASFEGDASFSADPATRAGTIAGTGRDKRSATRAEGEVRYTLTSIDGGKATRVAISLQFGLAGPLAQFGRNALVQDFVTRLTAQFARNAEAALAGSTAMPKQLDAGGMLWAIVKAWFARLFSRG
jgi:aerobic carbon-monoxide dehydrogenase small subunit